MQFLKLIRSLGAMLVVAVLALFVYHYYRSSDGRQRSDEATLIREQTQALQRQADEVNQRLRNARKQAGALQDQEARHQSEGEEPLAPAEAPR